MSIKSAWAYNNGKREMSRIIESYKSEKFGWIERNGCYLYAERCNTTNKLIVKVYANKKQVNIMIDKLTDSGFSVSISDKHPYTIHLNLSQLTDSNLR